MALGSCIQQSPHNNPPANPTEKQNKLANPQSPAERSDAGSDKAPILPKAPILSLVPSTKDFFMKFIKAFVEFTQVQDQE